MGERLQQEAKGEWWAERTLDEKLDWVGAPNVRAIEQLWMEATGLHDAPKHTDLTCDLLFDGDDDTVRHIRVCMAKDTREYAGVAYCYANHHLSG